MNNLCLKERNLKIKHNTKRERREGYTPGVIYGKSMKNLLFEVGSLELAKEISSVGDHGMINFSINGTEEKALIKEVQRDPVTHKIIHIDLEEICGDEKIQSEVPIHFVGEKWLMKKGEVLQKEKAVVKVSCNASDLPKSVDIDVSKGELGQLFKFADLEVGSEISIMDDLEGVIASISNERKLVSDLHAEEKINGVDDTEDSNKEAEK
ncbi:MAG: 50S ribosomal protein L25 [Clostridium sp.]|uniref:50S ribosomal protein L25 n=1 Tax=Clostridium sp. DSM 8431 TaxID=1761781 RepID=UPI0008F2C8AD|nr:50S ribosomal protein L25 [Clostridium sp. DSM 8431]MCR4943278.1 50S ribosomal protein L25 [Clostridium sp.]SFU28275.1 large subunit ribosomal protein L25 [Clostridium sp. DSM 8431]